MGVVDIFDVANRISRRINDSETPLFNVRVASPQGDPVLCSNGYALPVDCALDDVKRSDIVFLAAFTVAGKRELAQALESWQPVIQARECGNWP